MSNNKDHLVGQLTILILPSDTLFGDDLNCICFDHPNRETAMLCNKYLLIFKELHFISWGVETRGPICRSPSFLELGGTKHTCWKIAESFCAILSFSSLHFIYFVTVQWTCLVQSTSGLRVSLAVTVATKSSLATSTSALGDEIDHILPGEDILLVIQILKHLWIPWGDIS